MRDFQTVDWERSFEFGTELQKFSHTSAGGGQWGCCHGLMEKQCQGVVLDRPPRRASWAEKEARKGDCRPIHVLLFQGARPKMDRDREQLEGDETRDLFVIWGR